MKKKLKIVKNKLKKLLQWNSSFAIINKHQFYAAPIAQLDRAFDYESKGYGFNSCSARHRDVAQLGSALDLGSRGHRFKSCHPDHCGEVA